MLKYTYIFFIGALFLLSCSQQNKEKTLLEKEQDISNLHKKASGVSLDSSYYYLKKAAKAIHDNSLLKDSIKAENNYLLGLYFRKKENLDSAAIYFHNAIDYVNDSINNRRQVDYFNAAWNTYRNIERYGDCFTISNKFKSLLNKNTQITELSFVYYFEQAVYLKQKNYTKALEINALQLKLAIEKDTSNIPTALISEADIKYYYLNDKKGAFTIMDSLIKHQKEYTNDQKKYIYNNYGVMCFWERNYNKSLQYYLKSLFFTKKIKNEEGKKAKLAIRYTNIAEVYIELHQYKKAKKYLDSTVLLGINNIGKVSQKDFLKYQMRLAALTNNNINEVTQYLDTIYNFQEQEYKNKYNKELVALSRANTSEKLLLQEKLKTEIEITNLQATLLWGTILSSLLLLIGLYLYFKRKMNFERSSLQLQQRLLRSQMNPHFTFNTLYAIQNLIKKDPEKSTDYLLKFSRLLRLILDNSTNNYVQVENELESLTKYMELQLLRFPEKFKYTIVLHQMKEDDLLFIPPMLLQPFVENSIEHGFSNIDYLGEITITLSLQAKYILCAIEDNGLGITKKNKKNDTNSMVLISDFIEKATKSKIEVYNKKGLPGNQKGLLIKFLIPFKLSNND